MDIKNRYTGEVIRSTSGANLRMANLCEAKYSPTTKWPAPTAVILARWGRVSDALTADLMIFDQWCHPEPEKFDEWTKTNKCPYDECTVQRAANFQECRELWPPSSREICSPLNLMQRLLDECCVRDD